jgi:bacterial/archaeal transporter family protein
MESIVIQQPPLLEWIAPALVCALSYAFYNIFIKKGSYSINPVLGGVILQFVAAFLGIALLLALYLREASTDDYNHHENDGDNYNSSTNDDTSMTTSDTPFLPWDWKGVQWAICAGISVGTAEMISFMVSGMGVPAVQTIPIIIGGSVMFGTLLGTLLLGETLQWNGWLGVALLVGGICLVGIDPGVTHAH